MGPSLLGGVFLTNRGNNRRLREQLEHDRRIRNEERDLSLRKEVYLACAEAVSAGVDSIYRFANLEISNEEVTAAYNQNSPAIAKSYLIGGEDTFKAIANFVGVLDSTYYRLWAKRYPLMKEKLELKNLNEQIQRCDTQISQILELINRDALSGEKDQDRWKWIRDSMEFQTNLREDWIQKYGTIFQDLNNKQAEFRKECTAESAKLSRLLLPALIGVRKELNIPIGESTIREVFETNLKREEITLDQYTEEMNKLLALQQRPGEPRKK